MEVHLKIVGAILILLSLIHIVFPRYFDWKEDLKSISLINSQLMYVHTFFIAFIVFLMGIMCILSAQDLTTTKLGQQITFGLFIFWGLRLIFQLFVYSSDLWKKKAFETFVHILFTLTWIYITAVFFFVFKISMAKTM